MLDVALNDDQFESDEYEPLPNSLKILKRWLVEQGIDKQRFYNDVESVINRVAPKKNTLGTFRRGVKLTLNPKMLK